MAPSCPGGIAARASAGASVEGAAIASAHYRFIGETTATHDAQWLGMAPFASSNASAAATIAFSVGEAGGRVRVPRLITDHSPDLSGYLFAMFRQSVYVSSLSEGSDVSLPAGDYELRAEAYAVTQYPTVVAPSYANFEIEVVFEGGIEATGLRSTNPVIPDAGPNGGMRFPLIRSGDWGDPPATIGFRFEMVSPDSLFTDIMGLPPGFSAPFEVFVGGVSLGHFTDADEVNLAEATGTAGVTVFEIRGISPCVDGASDVAFPIQLAFSTPTATYDMIPINSAADVNESGSVTVQDIFDFLEFYLAGDPRGDFNGSGLPATVQDIFDLLGAYFAGCA